MTQTGRDGRRKESAMLAWLHRLVSALMWRIPMSDVIAIGGRTFPLIAGADDGDGDDSGGDGDDGSDDDGDGDDGDGDDSDDDDGDSDKDADESKLKKALKRERELRKTAQKEARAAKARATKAENKGKKGADDDAGKKAIDDAREEGRTEAERAANRRILRAEIKAAAAGKAVDPQVIPSLLNLDDFEVDEDGEVDEDEISEAIDELLEKKPYLKAGESNGGKPKGSADGGAKKTSKDDDKVTPGVGRLTQAYAESGKKKK